MVSDALVSEVDLLASFVALTHQKLTKDEGPDSFNMLPVLLGKTTQGRTELVEQENTPPPLALIQGHWKYIQPAVNKRKIDRSARDLNGPVVLGNSPKPQLYNLKKDIGEQHNVASKYPKKVKEMAKTLKKIVKAGRSRKE